MAAKIREKIKLISTGVDEKGRPTKFFYTTFKNKRNSTEKLKIMKFDPWAYDKVRGIRGYHVLFDEAKIK